jgi:hypothetical protein
MNYENTELTDISFSMDMPIPTSERRSSDRIISIYKSATIWVNGCQGLCLIKNISSGGLMGKVHETLPVSATIAIEIRSGVLTYGTIVWTNDLMVGVQFAEPIDVMDILHASSERGDRSPRMPRLNIPAPARLLVDGISRKVRVVDVSQGGAKIEADFLRPGDPVVISIEGLDACGGAICWVDDGRAGVSFNSPIAFEQLACWALQRQLTEKQAGIPDTSRMGPGRPVAG